MKKLVNSNLKKFESTYGMRPKTIKLIIMLPFLTISVITVILSIPLTRSFGVELLKENNLIELLTFLFLFLGGIKGLLLVEILKEKGLHKYEVIFYMVFSIGLLIVAMEEIAWGQWFFKFNTPEFWKEINMQGETTLHNIKGMQGHSEVLRFIFGFGGMMGILLSYHRPFQNVGAPIILFPYFIIIIIFSGLDFYSDYYTIHVYIDYGVKGMSEVVEMFIGISGLIYIWLNERKVKNLEYHEKNKKY